MSRLQVLQKNITTMNLDGIIITNPENRRYLSGFSGSAGVLLISGNESYIVTDFRYWEQVSQEVSEFELKKQGPSLWPTIVDIINSLKWKKVGFEAGNITYNDFQTFTPLFSTDIDLTPTTDLVEKQRWIKEEIEVTIIAKAAKITDEALKKTLAIIKPGIKEREIALEFDYQLRLLGADGSAFKTIVISGKKSALPHGAPSDKEVVSGELVLIDGGALYQGYHADMTRTFVLGSATTEQKRIYKIVLEAQKKVLNYLKAGLIGSEVDKIARDYLAEQGFKENFGHGLGHSVGLNIHESPRLSPTEANIIPKGAVITVEPGVYLPDWGGIRIEDLVVVNDKGITNLTSSPKDQLMEL